MKTHWLGASGEADDTCRVLGNRCVPAFRHLVSLPCQPTERFALSAGPRAGTLSQGLGRLAQRQQHRVRRQHQAAALDPSRVAAPTRHAMNFPKPSMSWRPPMAPYRTLPLRRTQHSRRVHPGSCTPRPDITTEGRDLGLLRLYWRLQRTGRSDLRRPSKLSAESPAASASSPATGSGAC